MSSASHSSDLFLDRSMKGIMRLAGFLSLSGLFATSALLIDANMVGPIGDETLAGLGLAASLYGLFMALLFGLGSSAQILLTKAYGTGDLGYFFRRLWALLIVGLLLCGILVLLFRFNIHFLVDHLATTSGIGFAAKPYLGLMVYGLPITFAAYLLSLSFDVRRQAPRELRGFAIEIPLNIILNALLIYGWLGAPKLGIEGAAIATLVSQSARLLYLMLLTLRDWRAVRLSEQMSPRSNKKPRQVLLPRVLVVPVTLNVAALIVGAQAYQLIFSQLPYLAFAALALMMPWLAISNVLGRAVALAATISCADLERSSPILHDVVGSILDALKSLAPKFALCFFGVALLVGGLSLHISSAVRWEFVLLIPLASLLVLIRTISVTFGAILRANDRPRWVFWVQVLLQWGFGLLILFTAMMLFELSLYGAFAILIAEEALRLGIMAHRLHGLRQREIL